MSTFDPSEAEEKPRPMLLIEGQGSLIREIRPRSAIDPLKTPIILSSNQLKSIKNLTQVPTASEYKEMRRRYGAIRIAEERRREERQDQIRNFDKKESSYDIEKEKEKREKSLAAMERAIAINVVNDEALRKAESVVLSAKCFAVRDAQLADAEQRRLHQHEEEMATIGAPDVFESLQKREEQDAEKRKLEGKKVADLIQQQIKEKREKSALISKRGEKVKDMERRAARRVKKDEEEKKQKQRQMTAKRAQEFQEYLREAISRRELEKQREKDEELALVQYMETKAKAEAEKEAELAMRKLEREQEIQRIRLLQQKERARITVDIDDKILRAQEEAERKWRLREEREQQKKANDRESYRLHHQKACAESRRKKMEEKQKAMEKAIEDARKFAEKAKKLDQEEEKEKLETKHSYLKTILDQMESDVERKCRQRSASLEEHQKVKLTRDIQEERIREALKEKYLELTKGPMQERHLGFVRAKFDRICKDQGLPPITILLKD